MVDLDVIFGGGSCGGTDWFDGRKYSRRKRIEMEGMRMSEVIVYILPRKWWPRDRR